MINKWMSREEFESQSHIGLCWVSYKDEIYSAYFYQNKYWQYEHSFGHYPHDEIKAVMPIEKPEYPKEMR